MVNWCMVASVNQTPPQETDQEHIEFTKRKEKTMPTHQSQLQTEIVKGNRELTPEERRMDLRREMFRELREMEMERRERASLEVLQKCQKERDEETERRRRQREEHEEERRRQEAKHKEEEERRADEQTALERQKQNQLKIEKLQWKKVMMVGEEPVTRPKFSLSDLEKEQQRRSKEAERSYLQKVKDKASFKCQTCELQGNDQSKRATLREQKTDCETVEKELHPHDYTHPPSTLKASPKTKSMYLICIHLFHIAFYYLFNLATFSLLIIFVFPSKVQILRVPGVAAGETEA